MIINADSLVPHLKDKVRPTHSDSSRHLICPHCLIRRTLNTLGDGRKKCTVCGKKFRINKVTDEKKLQQCAEILLCFCLDFSPNRTVQITHHRYRLVSSYYDHFRKLLAQISLPVETLSLIDTHADDIRILHNSAQCRWCKNDKRAGNAVVYGVRIGVNGEISIDPLTHEEAAGNEEKYLGFIVSGKFDRMASTGQSDDAGERLWSWIRERVRTHHGIWKKNTGYYLKELEWKYNNKDSHPHLQARKIIDAMPMDFLTSWLSKTDTESIEPK